MVKIQNETKMQLSSSDDGRQKLKKNIYASYYFVFCFGITYDCVKRVQASNNTLLDKPVNGVAWPSNVESEAPNMRIDIQKRNMLHPSFSESELDLNSPRRIVLCCSVIRS